MADIRKNIEAQMESHRFTAAQAARPNLTDEARAQSLAQAMLAAIKDGRDDQARALAIELRPLLSFLPEAN
jgi:hypothetical protein